MTIVVDELVEELVTQGVNSLVRIVSDNVKLVRGIDSEIKDLTSDIQMFNARLLEASKNPRANDHQVLRLIVNKFRSVVNEAEDTIADYVVLKKKHGNNFFLKSSDKTPVCGKVNGYASEIQSIRTKMKAIRKHHEKEVQDLMQYEIKDQDNAVKTFHQVQAGPTVEKNEVFGFKKDLEDMKARLLEASNNFIVIPIVGMPGTGKTRFASMLFEDLSILNNSVRIWVPVSKWCDRKHKFISIIYQITKSIEGLTTKSEEMLKDTIQTLLKDRKYFIILDDVWERKDWDSLRTAFPKNMNGSTVLVTTRHDNVVDSIWKSHNLEKLSDDDSWLLIKNNIFGTEGCNDTLEAIGMEIAKKCKGLPLALVVVAGILRKCITSTDWQRVADNPLLEINREYQSYHEIVKMSYNDLPHEKLKNCFLYFAYFPMGHEIAIWKLVCLWIAEGFIPIINEWEYRIDAEVEGQKYLNDLVDRNLVMVIKRRADGQIKTCRIHDTLHEFCKSEAARKNLFLVMDKEERIDENTCSARRLCFHSFTTADISDDQNKSSLFFLNWDDQMRSLLSPCGKHTHSLFLSSPQKSEVRLARDELASIPNIFPLLRVLNIESIKFNDGMLPKEVYRLYLLKYIAISGNLSVLPKSFKNLVELETLVIKTTARTLQIEGGIWNMEKLRHVRTNTSAQLPFPPETNSKTNFGGKHIHTLSTISPASCRKEIFSKTPNLRKLGVRGNLSELLKETENICLFKNLQMLKCLVNLKLYGQYEKGLTIPMLDKFARRLKMLSFSSTLFEWKDMAVLGSLEELEVLKLDDYAFQGLNWELSNNVVFRRLQYLRIGRTNLVTWKLAAHNSFPALRGLVLRNCTSLERIPESFAKVHTLKVMELSNVSESATRSVKEVQENIKNSGFKLIITSYQKREGPMAARDTLIEQAVSNTVNCLVERVELWHLENGGVEWEIKNLISDIETFNARLEEAYENPTEVVDVLIVKNFQSIVNEAWDAVDNWRTMYIDQKDKTFTRKFMVPRYRREIKSFESEIQSVRTKVNTIDHEYKKELETLCNYEKNTPLIFQKSTMYDTAIEAIEKEVNMLHQKILCEIKDMSHMTSQIKTFTEDLVKACKNPKANEHRVLKVIVKKFGILMIETMNAVTKYFAQEKKHGNNALAKSLDKIAHCGKPNVYASEIQSIMEKVKRISEDHNKDLLDIFGDYNKFRNMRLYKAENNIVGFIDDLKTIKSRIMEASKDFVVIPIVGNAGTGKTTFALKIFEDQEVRKIFTHCIWLHVSRGFHRKQKFIDILHQISKQTEDFSTVLEHVLEAKVKELLEDERYLIVLDDVRKKEDWDSLKVSFPTNMKGSRVLVTTCSGNAVDSTWKSHSLGKLSNDDGWLLIKNNVFGTEESHGTLIEELGIKIAKKCNGLPHALVLAAGILRGNCITSDGWQPVADDLLQEIKGEDQSYHKLVELSYNDLRNENLKNCFLYFACFPKGHEIVAQKLIFLWIAEGFIPTDEDEWGPLDKEVEGSNYLNVIVNRNLVMVKKGRAKEVKALNYLNVLVNRNLVMVKKRSVDGQIKTCCIHDTLHEFGRSEAERENLFHVMDEGQRLNARIRLERLCSYYTMNIFDVENNNPSDSFSDLLNEKVGPYHSVHSLLLSSSQKSVIHSTPEQLETILKTFKYLSVLNIESLKFSSLPNELYSQRYIRYLAITADISSLPKSFEHLSWLETLVIKTTERALQINGGIWNMEKLRHVHTNTSTQLPTPPKTGKHSYKQTDIRTLSTISPGSCTNEIFNMTPKLQKLGVRGDLSELLLEKKQNVCLFNNIQMLERLENLKLHGNSEEVKLKVPMVDKFPRRLRKLTLSGTLFQWNDMTVLGLLEELEVLKLDDNAFSGEELNSDVIFKRLKYLRIGEMNLKTWTVVEPEKSFPVLETLVLKNCISLQNIPQNFANVDSLELMELFDVSERVANFAIEICEKRHGKTNVKINGFNLFITPVPSQAMEHNQAYGDENVNTNRFEHPSTSALSEEIVHKQSNGEENVNTSGFDHPGTSTLSQEIDPDD